MTDQPPPPAVPAGWYPHGDVQRWWDGTAWTDHTAPLTAASVQHGPAFANASAPPSTRNRSSSSPWELVALGMLLPVGIALYGLVHPVMGVVVGGIGALVLIVLVVRTVATS
jgi:hypothetical protein